MEEGGGAREAGGGGGRVLGKEAVTKVGKGRMRVCVGGGGGG